MRKEEKHFLDTSILLPLICSTSEYKQYLQKNIKDKKSYVPPYVKMEMRRSVVITLIEFYLVLECPATTSFAEALRLWTQKFSKRSLAAVMIFVASLIEDKDLITADKSTTLRYLSIYIRRIDIIIRLKFKETGSDSTYCPKPKILLEIKDFSDANEITDSLQNFAENFKNPVNCDLCKIQEFVNAKHSKQFGEFLRSDGQSKNTDHKNAAKKDGYLKIKKELEKLNNGAVKITCRKCGSIGDAVITVISPDSMQLEHTDDSFVYLCPLAGKPHQKLLSEISYRKTLT